MRIERSLALALSLAATFIVVRPADAQLVPGPA